MSIKVGDTVKAIRNGCGYERGRLYTIGGFTNTCSDAFVDVIDQKTGKKVSGCYIAGFEKVEPPKHEGKILIMVDEKDNNKIIARDLLTNKTAEAIFNPRNEWDFNKGAKLALERLTEPEKPKGWTGKVVCVSTTETDDGFPGHNDYFDMGKVYDVINGDLYYKPGKQYTGIQKVTDPKDLHKFQIFKCPVHCDFIEFKGEVTSNE